MPTPYFRRALIAAMLGLLAPMSVAQPVETPPAAAPHKKLRAGDIAAAKKRLLGSDLRAASAAAADLGASKLPAAHDALLDALATGVPPDVASAAIQALVAAPAPADVAALAIYARHRDTAVRVVATGALSRYPDPEARKLLVAALGDSQVNVRGAAADALARAKSRDGIDRLFVLFARGEDAAVRALAQLADPELARQIADKLGHVPDAALAKCLGLMLVRTDFGPDDARVEVVRALSKIQGPDATAALTAYVDKTPAKPVRPSRKEAQTVIGARQSGGGS